MSQQPMKRLEKHSLPMTAGGKTEWRDYYLAADVEAMEARLKFLEAGNPYASKEWGDLVAVSGKAKGDVLAAKLLISQLQPPSPRSRRWWWMKCCICRACKMLMVENF